MKKKSNESTLFYRDCAVDKRSLDEENRSVELSFSSETGVKRYYGSEYLLHGAENVRMERIQSMGAGLLNHDSDIIIGRLENVRIDGRIGRATLIFDTDEDGEKAFGKVKSGSLKGVSVGYRVFKFVDVEAGDSYDIGDGRSLDGPAMVAIDWEPHEISLTPIPADPSVGVERSLDGIEIVRKLKPTTEETMDKKEIQEVVRESLQAATPDFVSAIRDQIREDSKPKMRISAETCQDLLGRAGAHSVDLKAKVADMAMNGKTEREIINCILDDTTPRSTDSNDSGNGPGSDGSGMDERKVNTENKIDFEHVSDEDFFRALGSPRLLSM